MYTRTNPGTPTEFRIRKADGSYLYVETIATNLIGVPGINGIVSTTRPIEERRKFDDALKRSEERFRGITERISDLIIITDPEGTPTYLSPSVRKILGYSPEGYTKADLHPELFPDDDIIMIGHAIKRITDGSPEEQIEFRMKKTDGSTAIFEGIGRPVIEDGIYTGVQVIARDITRRKNAENSLRIQHDLVLDLNQCTSLEDTCDRILSATLQIGGLDSGGIYISNPVTGALDLLVSRGLSPRFVSHVLHFDQDTSQVSWARAGIPYYGTYADLRQPETDEIRDKEDIKTVASIPVLHEGKLIALVNVASHTQDDIPPASRQILETLASEVGGAVDRIRSRIMLSDSEERYRSLVEN
ncbi:MAG: PAS domain S-box protein, partial [Deltaproteobacteria bacterium]